jgi:hypothetical protein
MGLGVKRHKMAQQVFYDHFTEILYSNWDMMDSDAAFVQEEPSYCKCTSKGQGYWISRDGIIQPNHSYRLKWETTYKTGTIGAVWLLIGRNTGGIPKGPDEGRLNILADYGTGTFDVDVTSGSENTEFRIMIAGQPDSVILKLDWVELIDKKTGKEELINGIPLRSLVR